MNPNSEAVSLEKRCFGSFREMSEQPGLWGPVPGTGIRVEGAPGLRLFGVSGCVCVVLS